MPEHSWVNHPDNYVREKALSPIMRQLVEFGRARLATRPGYRPRMLPSMGANHLSEALKTLREEEPW